MSKLIPIYKDIDELIRQAKQSNQKAQLALYDQFSAKMLGCCRQYIKDLQFAEDVMIMAFHKAFLNINRYEPYGSFEGWLRRIMVRECISHLRIKKNTFNTVELGDYHFSQTKSNTHQDDTQYIRDAINGLPIGCKTVFNLYVMEGYKHREISELLNISIGTSKSQLAHAKKLLRLHLKHLNSNKYGTK
uniref:RNA polymerase sigma factor n=1 Tax=Winogradskyella luteola TaxID=2828330 RepID=A0A9X1FAY6_9FLAO|nr:RNA polymerase sigma factor [Winogradskyella luteola]MBV7270510.1 RNA polymerase sigma factor [Winogradskyella luteola]